MSGILLILFVAALVLVFPDMEPGPMVVLLAAMMIAAWVLGPRTNVHEKRRPK